MKIGLVRRGYSPTGGAERYLLRFADALRAEGHEALLFASPEWPAASWTRELVRVAGKTPRQFADRLRALRPKEHCDLLFSLERVWECDAYRAGDGVHRAWLDRRRAFEAPWRGWARVFQRKHRDILALEHSLFDPAANRIILANSRMVAGEISRYYGLPETQVCIVYNGLPAPGAQPIPTQREETRAKLGLRQSEWAVLFAGSGWERKGLRFAIEGINRLNDPDIILLVAGAGKKRGLPSSPRVRFLGEIAEMPALMEAADAFLLPTIYDPFSNACLEALSAGLPVITTAANGFAEIMRPSPDGAILSTLNAAGIAESVKIWRETETPALRAQRRVHASAYTIERNVRETIAALAGKG